jgi:hypothetical protein
MKRFEEFIKEKEVKKATPDKELAKSLVEEAETRIEIALEMKLDEKRATVIFELLYDSLRELIDALLALEGYKSYSHEANIAYLKKLPDFSDFEVSSLDSFRRIRNSSKYYGKPAQISDVSRIKDQLPALKEKLLRIIKCKLK